MSFRDLFRRGVPSHVALHARLERKNQETARDVKQELRKAGFKKEYIAANVRGLKKLVNRLDWKPGRTEWNQYGATTSYTDADAVRKEAFVREVVHSRPWELAWDVGCNRGNHARIAAENSRYVVAIDGDAAVADGALPRAARRGRHVDPPARRRRDRPVARARLGRRRAAAARGARHARPRALPRRHPPRRHLGERAGGGVPLVAPGARLHARDRVPDPRRPARGRAPAAQASGRPPGLRPRAVRARARASASASSARKSSPGGHASSTTPCPGSGPPQRARRCGGAHLLAASGFALAQPLFDILGKNAEFFAVRGSTPSDIVHLRARRDVRPGDGAARDRAARRPRERARRARPPLRLPRRPRRALRRAGAEAPRPRLDRRADRRRNPVGIGIAYRGGALAARPDVHDDPRGRAGRLPLRLPLQLVGDRPRLPRRHRGARRERRPVDARSCCSSSTSSRCSRSWTRTARSMRGATRTSRAWPRRPRGSRTRRPSPPRPRSRCPRCSPGSPRQAQAPGVPELPAQPVHAARQGLPDERHRVADAALPAAALRPRDRRTRRERLSGLYSDARIVYLHLLSPPALEDRLPAIDESWGEFGNEPADAGDSLSGVTVEQPKQEGRRSTPAASATSTTFVDSLKPPVEGKPTLDFLHVLLPHGPWLYFPDGRASAVASRQRAGPKRRALVGRRPREPGAPAAPPPARVRGHAARRVPRQAREDRPLGQGARRSSRPTTGSASTATTCAARRPRRTSPSSRSRRSSSSSPASRRARSSIAT